MKEIYFDFGVKYVLFIRYNPDKYTTLDDEKMIYYAKRRTLLVEFIKEQLNKFVPDHNLGVVYLFYDGFSLQSVEVEKIEPYPKKE